MNRDDRKAAAAAYKEQTVTAGIYAVRCQPTGQCWVGRAPDLATIQNRLWFTLRHQANPHRSLQAAWREHGPDAFTFEILERIGEEEIAYVRERLLKDRLAHWATELQATII